MVINDLPELCAEIYKVISHIQIAHQSDLQAIVNTLVR